MALALVSAVTATACSGDETEPSSGAVATTTTTVSTTVTSEAPPEGTLDTIELATQQIVELDEPIALAARPSTPDLYLAQRDGRVRLVKVTEPAPGGTGPTRYQLQNTPVLDLRDEVLAGGERGLLGLAFSTDGRTMYVDFTARPDGRTVVLEYELGDRTTVDPDTRRELLEIEQPAANHNGGQLVVGPDGYLYVGLGDGGGPGDPDQRAQDRDDLLGKILRIDPQAPRGDRPYGIPAGNPFADGEDGAPEVWTYGVRNPWRFTFDRGTGDLWVADVGQDAWEEVDWLPAAGGFDAGRGVNLGWDRMEGTHPREGQNPPGATLPILEYSHDEGCSIIGGYVYRGDAIEELRGTYLFADYCAPGIRGIQVDDGTVIDDRTWDLGADGLFSFGQDRDGEVFLLRSSGPVLKLVPSDT
ncbi:MAG: PQQ-dependent sugar dehydrogenase [Acidimicrobiales bacterium]